MPLASAGKFNCCLTSGGNLPNQPNLFGLQGYLRGKVCFDENLECVANRFGILFVKGLDSLLKFAKRREPIKQSLLVD